MNLFNTIRYLFVYIVCLYESPVKTAMNIVCSLIVLYKQYIS